MVTGHGLVNRQVVNRPHVVLAKKGLDLFIGPLLGQGGDGVEGLLPHVEGTRRVAVGQGHSPAKLGHDDDLDGIVGNRDDLLFPHELLAELQRCPGGPDDLAPAGTIGVGDLESRPDDRLLVGLGGIFREASEGIPLRRRQGS